MHCVVCLAALFCAGLRAEPESLPAQIRVEGARSQTLPARWVPVATDTARLEPLDAPPFFVHGEAVYKIHEYADNTARQLLEIPDGEVRRLGRYLLDEPVRVVTQGTASAVRAPQVHAPVGYWEMAENAKPKFVRGYVPVEQVQEANLRHLADWTQWVDRGIVFPDGPFTPLHIVGREGDKFVAALPSSIERMTSRREGAGLRAVQLYAFPFELFARSARDSDADYPRQPEARYLDRFRWGYVPVKVPPQGSDFAAFAQVMGQAVYGFQDRKKNLPETPMRDLARLVPIGPKGVSKSRTSLLQRIQGACGAAWAWLLKRS